VATLQQEVAAALAAIAQLPGAAPPPSVAPAAPPPEGAAQAHAILAQMAVLLVEDYPAAMALAPQLTGLLTGPAAVELATLARHLEEFEVEQAQDLVRRLQQRLAPVPPAGPAP
jgi:hypothetical protein